MVAFDPIKIKRELDFLQAFPHFDQRPASIREFVSSDYLNLNNDQRQGVRPGIMEALVDIFGEEVSGNVISKVRRAMVTGAIGIGKGELVTEPVLTPTGWRAIGTLSPGDEVVGADGYPVKVTGVYPRGILPTFDVEFTDGTYLTVDGDHIWTVDKKVRGRNARTVRMDIDTRTLSTTSLKREGQSWDYSIPMVEPVHYQNEDAPLPVQPYLMGLLLGDGCFTKGTITLAGDDLEVEDYIDLPYGVEMVRNDRDWNFVNQTQGQKRWNGNALTAAIRGFDLDGKTSHTKFIPEPYMRSNSHNRLETLRGLMDADGGVFGRNSTRFSSVNLALCEQVLELVQSLGGTGSIGSFERRGGIEYWVQINSAVNPFKISRKAVAWKPRGFKKPMRYVKSVTPSGVGEIVCIAVDSLDQLYVTSDFIVTHNTTFASIALPYMVHWVLCLKNPQEYFDLLDGSRIAFMQMSTSEDQAKEVLFGDIDARIKHSPWFVENFQRDPAFKNQIRFPKDIWILPGDSAETTFEGYNILAGILDEGDSHKVTTNKDYAESGFDTIHGRITSRFQDRGLLIVIGQMKKGNGFMARKYAELLKDDEAHTVRMTIWESLGWDKYLKSDGTRDSFFYDKQRKSVVPPMAAKVVENSSIIEVPMVYRKDFDNNPEKALRDLAGIPPATGDPFISLVDKIHACRDRWSERYPEVGSPIGTSVIRPEFAPWFTAPDSLRRAVHIDLAYSANGDALGLAMGHVREMVEIDEELKPYIVFDMLYRVKAAPGTEIILGDIRHLVYRLRDDLRFRIKKVTMDGFQSTDSMQQFRKRKIDAEYVSVDRNVLPYHDLREAIYEGRVEFPPYMTHVNKGDIELVEIAVKELTELTDTGRKIDHPQGGSKDVTDAMAGVVTVLMGDRQYRKGIHNLSAADLRQVQSAPQRVPQRPGLPSQASIPSGGFGGGMLLPVPTRLTRR